MSSDEDSSRLLVFRVPEDDVKEFFELFKESDLGKLIKAADGDDYENNKENSLETMWSEWGAENLDDKQQERMPLI